MNENLKRANLKLSFLTDVFATSTFYITEINDSKKYIVTGVLTGKNMVVPSENKFLWNNCLQGI